ncbi:MAG: LPS export ABC transporter periplasmic protein LptC, partial [Blastocatellia bacterium]|nr:LPS export ABC transporter periplasmic protein LptC [Blastocatellia bacterium]
MRNRARLPYFFRAAAIVLFGVSLLAIGIGFYKAKNRAEFRMQGFPTELSKDVVASISNYERRETEGDMLKYLIRADKATTFADNHQEMENVYLEVFDEGGGSDTITAAKAIYVPGERRMFTAYFAGDVSIATRDSLRVKTDQLTYKREDETASSEEQVEFERLNVKGRSFGAVVDIAARRVHLLRDVNIEVTGDGGSQVGSAVVKAGSATYDQVSERIDLENSFTANVNGASGSGIQNADVSAGRAVALLSAPEGEQRRLKSLEMFENVKIDTKEGDGRPTKIESGYAMYSTASSQFDLGQGVRIVTVEDSSPTVISASSAKYQQNSGRIDLVGGVEVAQKNDLVKGDNVTVFLYPNRKLKNSIVKGNAFVRQAGADRTTELSAAEINADFGENQEMRRATAINSVRAVLVPAAPAEYSRITMSTGGGATILFKGAGLIDQMNSDGRTTINMD